MTKTRLITFAATAALALALAGCTPATPVVAPVVVNTSDIQGGVVTVALDQVVQLNTGGLAVDSYTATIDKPSIAEFVQGKKDGGAEFNPGLKPLKEGETEVILKNKQGGIQWVTFTLKVTK